MEDRRRLYDALWPIFGFGRYFGMFPCKREKDGNRNGHWKLAPIGWKLYWSIFFIKEIIQTVLYWGVWREVLEYIKVKECETEEANEHYVDYISKLVTVAIAWIWGWIINYGTFTSKGAIIEVYESPVMAHLQSSKSRLYKQTFGSIILVVLALLSNTLAAHMENIGCLEDNWHLLGIDYALSFLSYLIDHVPFFIFLSLYFEITGALHEKLRGIRKQLLLRAENRSQVALLYDIKELAYCLETSAQIFSFNICFILPIFFISFNMILYFLGVVMLTTREVSKICGLSPSPLTLLVLVWLLNSISHSTLEEMGRLKSTLAKTYLDPERLAEYEGQIVPISFIQACTIESLDQFKGFDGLGYFVLGKSYMAKFITFFITIFVIIVQFKMSEISFGSSNCE